MTFKSSSSARTKAFAHRVAAEVLRRAAGRPARRATVIRLAGELGSGKTTFVQGFARAVGARGRAVSPTFILMRRMKIRAKGKGKKAKEKQQPFTNLYHIDAYRLSGARAARALGLREALAEPRNLILVEWPERIKGALPKNSIRLTFRHGEQEQERYISFTR